MVDALAVAVLPATLVAVTVQVPAPVPLVLTEMMPLVPEPVPTAAPEQLTEAEVAPLVPQVRDTESPVVTLVAPKLTPVTLGGATTFTVLLRVTCVPAALLAVTVQVPAPTEAPALAVKLLFKPVPLPVTAPEHATEALVALLVVQLNPTDCDAVTLLAANAALATLGATMTLVVPLRVVMSPEALVADTAQVAVPVPLVVTVMLPLVPEPEPEAAPEQATVADTAPLVAQLKFTVLPLVT